MDLIKTIIKEQGFVIEKLLEDYSRYLENIGYLDSDWYCEEPNTVLDYMEIKQK